MPINKWQGNRQSLSLSYPYAGQFFVLNNCGRNCHLWIELDPNNIWTNEDEPEESGEDRTTDKFIINPEDRMSVS